MAFLRCQKNVVGVLLKPSSWITDDSSYPLFHFLQAFFPKVGRHIEYFMLVSYLHKRYFFFEIQTDDQSLTSTCGILFSELRYCIWLSKRNEKGTQKWVSLLYDQSNKMAITRFYLLLVAVQLLFYRVFFLKIIKSKWLYYM